MRIIKATCLIATSIFVLVTVSHAQQKGGRVVTETLVSSILRGTRTGLDSSRLVKVYLPPGYADPKKFFPVIYYFHSVFSSAESTLANGRLVQLLDRSFERGNAKEFILVVADYSSPTTGSIYENSPATGRWLDFTTQELLPFIDSRFRTIRHRDSRGLAGEMMGGRGAFQLAMLYPELFSVIYAMNPVATGIGLLPMPTYPKWDRIHRAKSFSDLQGDHISAIFVTICQAFLPNPDRPPFYCDFFMEPDGNTFRFHPENAAIVNRGFLLDHKLEERAVNLRAMRGIAFDWARYDPIQDHVYGSETFSRQLESFGVQHEAEEYRGVSWEKNWSDDGRFYTRLVPFFDRHLVFQ